MQTYNKIQFVVTFLILIIFNISRINGFNKIVKENNNRIKYLNNWQFQIDIANIGEKEKWYLKNFDKSKWTKVTVPSAWDTYNEALWGYEGIGWYFTKISKETIQINKLIRIKFNRVNYHTKIWLNDIFIGENIGGYLPFEVDITDLIKKNEDNYLVLKVDNKPRINWLPASKQIEWVQYGGILEHVELLQTNRIYIQNVAITTNIQNDNATIETNITLNNKTNNFSKIDILVTVLTEQKKIKKLIKTTCKRNSLFNKRVKINIPKPKLWSITSPNLYELNITVSKLNKIIDKKKINFGIKNIKINKRKILVNNKVFKIKGVNRYDIFDKRGPIQDEEIIKKDLLKIKEAGVNLIRVHYPQSPLTLKLLDEIGLFLIEELPINWWGQNWWDSEKVVQDTSILKQARITLKKMIQRDRNHACLFAWSLANESKTNTTVGNYVITQLIKQAKQLDTTHLITFTVNNNVKLHSAFSKVDFVSRNIYFGNDKAFHKNMLDSLVRIPSEKEIKNECKAYPGKPFIVSEFGTAGIKNISGDLLFSEDLQAEYIKSVWKAIENVPECSGGILWCWSDYYHRKFFNSTYNTFGPYGILDINKIPKKSFEVLKKIYNN